jgi:oleandomycin transport system ATP-binding protein
MTDAIQADGLAKSFGATRALDGIDLTVPTGTVLGLLGPNGSGKTTTVRILATLLAPSSGRASVAGHDVIEEAAEVRTLIGLTGQYAAVDDALTGSENLIMVGRLLDLGGADARRRTEQLLERFDLTEAAHRPVKTYSGGMQRRLDLALSLVGRPQVLFLDEPTTGLDPRSRTELWSIIRELVGDGATVLLTTQYLDEADRLDDCFRLGGGCGISGRRRAGTACRARRSASSTRSRRPGRAAAGRHGRRRRPGCGRRGVPAQAGL